MRSMELTAASDTDIGYAEGLLRESGLPVADLDRGEVVPFVGRVDGRRVGICGLEIRGPYALVRSVAVEPDERGDGYGTTLIERLFDYAHERDVRELYLLTEGAEGFFSTLGFERTEREAVPEVIRETSEFTEVCPISATCLRRTIG